MAQRSRNFIQKLRYFRKVIDEAEVVLWRLAALTLALLFLLHKMGIP